MDVEGFIQKLEEEFDELAPGSLTPDTVYAQLEEWDSMHALILLALVDFEYGVFLEVDDILSAVTIGELFDLIAKKAGL